MAKSWLHPLSTAHHAWMNQLSNLPWLSEQMGRILHRLPPSVNKTANSSFETQRRCRLKYKPGASVAPQIDIYPNQWYQWPQKWTCVQQKNLNNNFWIYKKKCTVQMCNFNADVVLHSFSFYFKGLIWTIMVDKQKQRKW